MRCKKCGSPIPEGARFCADCGAPVEQASQSGSYQTYQQPGQSYQTYQQPSQSYQQQAYSQPREPKAPVTFPEAVKLYFTRYADFSGRSRRSEYWWACLFNLLVGAVIGMILPDLSWIWTLATLVPSIAICVRRLHDVGKSGVWYLWILLPLVGAIILLVQFCHDSTEDNQWGPNPKY